MLFARTALFFFLLRIAKNTKGENDWQWLRFLFMRTARPSSALSTLRGVRPATSLAIRLGSPRPSVTELIRSS